MSKVKFSVVIPLAPDRNAEILEDLKKLDYPKLRYEIIVEKGLNPSENRNKGAKKGKGEIIAFLDDDAYVEKDILKKTEEFFKKYPNIDIVGGPQLTPPRQEGFGKISGYALTSIFGCSGIRKRYKRGRLNLNADETHITSSVLFCKKKVFKKVQFNPLLFPGEDPDFIENAKKQGFKVAYTPDIFIYHKRRETLPELAKQIFSYGKTRLIKENLKQTLRRPFFLIPSAFVIYLFLLLILNIDMLIINYLLFQIPKVQEISFIFSLPLSLYLLVDILFSFFISVKEKSMESFFVLPFVFLTIHLSYGLGMLYTLIKNPRVKAYDAP